VPADTVAGDPVLSAVGLCAGYGPIPVLRDIDLRVNAGEIVALLGPNGSGKTTTMLALAGELRCSAGQIRVNGAPAATRMHRRARQGVAFVPDTRGVFGRLSVRDNLRLGRVTPASALAHAPELTSRVSTRAGLLSGGEQQILAVARAIARRPRLLLIDELSLGLAPIVVQRLITLLRAAADDGVAVLVVEQHVQVALGAADRVYVLKRGEVVHSADAAHLRKHPEILEQLYLARGDRGAGATTDETETR